MQTFHIHIQGIVQGVGFRPFVYQLAVKNHLKGWVNNTADGVHVEFNTTSEKATVFLQELLDHLPVLAVVTSSELKEVPFREYDIFEIISSQEEPSPKVLLTPDVAICEDCLTELNTADNRRFQYPFITCTNCGPRYSIIQKLPYDRHKTTMDPFSMCDQCSKEYHDPLNRRHYSQTNSCLDCRIEMQLYENGKITENFTDLDYIISRWKEGKIIAIKGIGGYLLTCDATDKDVVSLLRERKNRPEKPFALMYPDIEMISDDVYLHQDEINELKSIAAPVVLLKSRSDSKHLASPAVQEITKGLHRLGIMLPYTPLYEILLQRFKKPIVATSGNISDSTIIYKDLEAVEELRKIADLILMNNREILIPQDDGVVQFTEKSRQKITLRRSRGKAPVYINPKLKIPKKMVFTSGSMLKSVFGIFSQQNIYISQYLGNTSGHEAQVNYEMTFRHFEKVLNLNAEAVVSDKHPDYFSTRFAEKLADKNKAVKLELQHHKAHFYAVLGENNLLDDTNILGVVWDGTGLGDDGNIWGGEFFAYRNKTVKRIGHLEEFNYILGDKMAKEPRISALSVTHHIGEFDNYLKDKFSITEWNVYQKLLQKNTLKSTSMGRLFDAVASLLFDYDHHSFEAEASMKLEKQAQQYLDHHKVKQEESYLFSQDLPEIFLQYLLKRILADMENKTNRALIAVRFHLTLVDYIRKTAEKYRFKKIAFSGGVFQNALLVDMIFEHLNYNYDLYFHKEFSPNDEGIPFGQLVYYSLQQLD